MDRRVRSHLSQGTTSRDDWHITGMVVTDRSVTIHSTTHSVCNATSSVWGYYSTPFIPEWSVRRTSIASLSFHAKP